MLIQYKVRDLKPGESMETIVHELDRKFFINIVKQIAENSKNEHDFIFIHMNIEITGSCVIKTD